MKAPLKFVLAVFGVVTIVACAFVGQHKGNVEFGKHYAAIFPEANVSESDCNALNQVLKKYDKSIYRIQTFKNGKVIKTRGALVEEYMRTGLVSEVAKKAEATGFTGCALQAGVVVDAIMKTSSTHPTPEAIEAAGGTSSTHPTPTPEGGTSSTHPTPTPSYERESATPTATPGGTSSTHPTPSSEVSSARRLPKVGSSTLKMIEDSEKMMEQVRPILEKYNKQ